MNAITCKYTVDLQGVGYITDCELMTVFCLFDVHFAGLFSALTKVMSDPSKISLMSR